jgi:hypothetical protein
LKNTISFCVACSAGALFGLGLGYEARQPSDRPNRTLGVIVAAGLVAVFGLIHAAGRDLKASDDADVAAAAFRWQYEQRLREEAERQGGGRVTAPPGPPSRRSPLRWS